MRTLHRMNRGYLPVAILGVAASFLTVACGSSDSTIASVSPDVATEATTSLQLTTRPVIYRPGVILGSLPTFADSITFQGTGFANVTSVTFLGGPLAGDDEDADFTIVGDNTLIVEVPGGAATGLIRVATDFNAAYRLYIAPPPPPPPAPPEIFIATSTTCDEDLTQPLDFGNPPVQTTSTRSFVVCNVGEQTLEVSMTALDDADPSGDGIDDYAITSQPEFEVAPGSFASITVQCTPSEAESNLNAVVQITSNDVLAPATTDVDLTCRMQMDGGEG